MWDVPDKATTTYACSGAYLLIRCRYGVTQLSELERQLRAKLKHTYLSLASMDPTMARRRSTITWLGEGDANTAFFH